MGEKKKKERKACGLTYPSLLTMGGAFFFFLNLFSKRATAREAYACESVEWYCKSGVFFFFNWQLHKDAE